MAIHSVFLPISPEEARVRLGRFGRLADGFKLEFIPADGGCVVAAVPVEAKAPGRASSFRVAIKRRREERQWPSLFKTLAGETAELPAA